MYTYVCTYCTICIQMHIHLVCQMHMTVTCQMRIQYTGVKCYIMKLYHKSNAH